MWTMWRAISVSRMSALACSAARQTPARAFASGAHRQHPSLIRFTHGKLNEGNKGGLEAASNFFAAPVSAEERELLLGAPRTRHFLTQEQMELIELGGAAEQA
jgi:hypothetical protein